MKDEGEPTKADLWLIREELMRTLSHIGDDINVSLKHFQEVLDAHYTAIKNLEYRQDKKDDIEIIPVPEIATPYKH